MVDDKEFYQGVNTWKLKANYQNKKKITGETNRKRSCSLMDDKVNILYKKIFIPGF